MKNNNKNNRDLIIIAALLHDIGKFMQRAELPLSSQSKNMEGSICPSYKGKYSHRHVLWINEFFENYKNFFPINVFKKITDNPLDNCANFASYHHNPETPFQIIIQEADCLSSGMDRLPKDIEDEITGRNMYKKIRLHSLFENIDIGNNPREEPNYRYELNSLIPTRANSFPKVKEDLEPKEGESLVENYNQLWNEFINEFKKLPNDDFNTFFNSLFSLLEKYTWCIPSSTIDLPDISLFDHCKTTAAIAACLYEYHKQSDTFNDNSIKDRDIKKFLLVAGDLSGIQKYIFDLSRTNVRGVSKRLRARSFYLQSLTEISIHYILQRTGLPLICNVMDAGGRFILLMPNTKKVKENLKNIYREISDWFRKTFGGELVLNLNWDLELCGDDFKVEKLSNFLDKLTENIEAKKYGKLSEIIVKNENWLENKFLLEELYKYDKGTCQSCEKYPAVVLDKEEGREIKLCSHCAEQKKIGKWLTKSKILAYSQEKPSLDEYISFFDDKYYLSFWEKDELHTKEYYFIEQLYSPDVKHYKYGTKYLANYIPLFNLEEEFNQLCPKCRAKDECEIQKEVGIPKAFDCIATKAITINEKGDKFGSSMLGILKADVDHLGFIFSLGLENKMSISRYLTLSRMMDFFFSGYIYQILSQKHQNIYTVYSGGDDLFLISDWETIIQFAEEMYSDFREFACKNIDITLSSGIATIKPKFPIRRGADIAGELLEDSKNHGRDRITMFNTTVEWQDSTELFKLANLLDEEFRRKDSKISSAFLYRLLKYHNMYLKWDQDKDIRGLIFHALMAYDIERNIKDEVKVDGKKVIKNKKLLDELLKLYFPTKVDKKLMKNLKIPLFWTLYKNRGK